MPVDVEVQTPRSAQRDLLLQRIHAAEQSKGISADAVYDAVVQTIESLDLKGVVLDYGAGVGNLTRRLIALERFEAVFAADIMAQPQDLQGVHWIAQDLNCPVEGYENAFDVVVAAEVIEHLENPRLVVRELSRMVRPGGTVIVTTPNNESWRSLVAFLVRGHYAAFGDLSYPAHITALLRKDFTRICSEAKLSAPTFSFANHGGIPGKPSLSWQKISLGLLGGMRYSDTLLVVARKPL
jgi:2-polyprenyl-3-methyl-5-hydroxy-6-metoxy-1,4-benzoquinol methylase